MKFRTVLIIAVLSAVSCLSLMPEYVKWKNPAPADRAASSVDVSGENAIRQLKKSGDYESLGAAVTAARYAADVSGDAVSAENYANQMTAAFSPEGLVLESDAPDSKWRSRWHLQNLHYGNQKMNVGAGEVETNGSRVAIKRLVTADDESAIRDPQPAIVEEWFNNTPAGLEHGFTLRERLSESEGNLRLTVAVEGDLEPRADADGQNLRLFDKHGAAVLNYEKLKVWDAEGVEVVARMTTADSSVILEVEDADATYPLVIDPTFTAAAKLTANDGSAGDWFGQSVAVSGDTVVVGAPIISAGRGFAYVFERGANGLWVQQTKLAPTNRAANDNFGASVAISNDTIIVGAPEDPVGTSVQQGSAYIFVPEGRSWALLEKVTASDGAAGDKFGSSVAISGETFIVGSPEDDIGNNSNQGSTYVYARSGGNWSLQQKVFAPDGGVSDLFAGAVSISGSTFIVGATHDDIGANNAQGSAYVYTRSGTTWTLQQKLTAADGAGEDGFGNSVGIWISIFGNATVVVGSYSDDFNTNTQQGSAYVFVRSGTIWTIQQKLTASDAMGGDFFGTSVAISGGTVIIGAEGGMRPMAYQGAAYVFTRSGTVWSERSRLTAYDGGSGDRLGYSVGISGETVIAGAFGDDVGTNGDQGSAHVFQLAAKPFDFDDDGRTDIGIFRPSGAQWWINRSSTDQTFAAPFGLTTDKVVPADYTGDGKTDIAVFRPSNGNWIILRSEDSSFYAFPFGASGDIPAPADYDGDRLADPAVFRPSSHTWFIGNSGGGTLIQQFGAAGDVPVAGDYDGDRRADVAIFRPNSPGGAQWWISRSSTGQVAALQFGNSTDKAVPSDYTGDGKTDIAFWRPGDGDWFVLRSEDLSFYALPFGVSGDVPVAGDYDGDGKSDAAVFRPSNSHWYVSKSTGGAIIRQFGAAGDVPLPGAFIP